MRVILRVAILSLLLTSTAFAQEPPPPEFVPGWDNHWLEVCLWAFVFKGFEFGVWFGRARQTL